MLPLLTYTYYSAPDRGAEDCDERVCLSVYLSVRGHIFGTTCPIFTKFLMHVTYNARDATIP